MKNRAKQEFLKRIEKNLKKKQKTHDQKKKEEETLKK